MPQRYSAKIYHYQCVTGLAKLRGEARERTDTASAAGRRGVGEWESRSVGV